LNKSVVQEIEPSFAPSLYGPRDEHLQLIEEKLKVKIIARGNELLLQGTDLAIGQAQAVIADLVAILGRGEPISLSEVSYAINLEQEGQGEKLNEISNSVIFVNARGKAVRPRTAGQLHYLEALNNNSIVFAIGPAGTGKTYMAMAKAVRELRSHQVERIVLTRPAVEAGEKLGFLPGDLQEKVDPYLRPLYDALFDLLGAEAAARAMERGIIEVAPLAYMRGRTLEDSYIILDEAQNTSAEQMKMFLTRLGNGSRMVITGDITQVDLPRGKASGLVEAKQVLAQVEGIAFVELSELDVVRHPLVGQIISAYAQFEARREVASEGE
jgi:phosphate starvation-inducible PhoH-like protein